MKKSNQEVYLSKSPAETKKIAAVLSKKVLKEKPQKEALVIGLMGELGSGKTTFAQGFARGMGIKGKILSPTFVIMKKFQIPNVKLQTNSKRQISKFKTFYHIDCYRIKKPKEILELGFREMIKDPKNIFIVEWAEKIKKIIPQDAMRVDFRFQSNNKRKIVIQ